MSSVCTRSHCGNFNKCTAPGDTLTAFFSDTGSTPVSSTKIKAPAVPRRVFLFWCFVSCRGVEQGGGTAVPARWPMRNADAVRSSSSVESLSLYQWFARCLNALRTARLPLIQGRHKKTRCVCIVVQDRLFSISAVMALKSASPDKSDK